MAAGTSVNSFANALIEAKVDVKNLAIVSGIGCTGRVAGYTKLDSFHTTHGRAIPFATGLKLANPKLNVVVYSGDTKFSMGSSKSSKPGSLDQVKEGNFINCSGTYNDKRHDSMFGKILATSGTPLTPTPSLN